MVGYMKIVAVEYHFSTCALDLGLSSVQKPVCKHCSGYLHEIALLNTELQSARKIIQLLQDDLSGIKNQPPWSEHTTPHVSVSPNNWKSTVARKSNPGNHRWLTKKFTTQPETYSGNSNLKPFPCPT